MPDFEPFLLAHCLLRTTQPGPYVRSKSKGEETTSRPKPSVSNLKAPAGLSAIGTTVEHRVRTSPSTRRALEVKDQHHTFTGRHQPQFSARQYERMCSIFDPDAEVLFATAVICRVLPQVVAVHREIDTSDAKKTRRMTRELWLMDRRTEWISAGRWLAWQRGARPSLIR